MSREMLVYARDTAAARTEVAEAGGRTLLEAAPHLLVISVPDEVSVGSIAAVTEDLSGLDEDEQLVADAWHTRFGAVSRPEERQARAARQRVVPWDAPGRTPPQHLQEEAAQERSVTLPPSTAESRGDTARSTDTPTSVVLTGSVAVGLVVVSGPATPPYWLPLHGALKHVSVSASGEVWGVNANDQIYRLNASSLTWEQMPGALAQVSSGSEVWGVNAEDEIYRWNGSSWTQVSGALKHVSVGDDGTVWGVNAEDEIYRWNGSSWTQVSGALKQISVADTSTVWGVNAEDEIYRWNGSSWTQVSGALKHVSVAADGSVVGVNADDKIYRYLGDSQWEQLPGSLKQVSASSAAVQWGVNHEDEIFRHDPSLSLTFSSSERSLVVSEVLEALTYLATEGASQNVTFTLDWHFPTVDVATGNGHDYEPMEAPWRDAALQQLGFPGSRAGSRQFVQSLRSGLGTDWAYAAYFTRYPLHHFAYAGQERLVMEYLNDGWGPNEINKVFAHETGHIFGAADEYGTCGCGASGHNQIPNNNCKNCTSNQVACLMNANTLTLCPWTRGQLGWPLWDSVAGALKHVSVGADGTVWGVNASDKIYRRDGNAWTQVSGALKQISVGNAANVWGVNKDDKIYRRTGDTWTRVPGALKHVSVAADGTVWGVNASDNIYRRDGNAWTQVPGALRQISSGNAAAVWGVNAGGNIYRRTGSSWTQVPGSLKHVSVAADGTIWGVNSADRIYRWTGAAWEQFPGALKQVSVGAWGLVWGVNASDKIYRLI
ncbi:hypothetical protein KZX45_13910 [Georgenia sp. EYE_87]|uniref:tectonin domain-containing protein n=1 Tax=Georgenia sp. EYE_87 TaxID=2853448 RepID=UPI002005F11E|nr:tectonin domain-containing protein [Georgenia sp. EYE_87]MCK6211640.1 hypothetical protein [Georgenia sp. EYE_87]